jgi:putative endonuclease
MAKKKKWVVYIIRTGAGKLYTGITTDLERRFSEHQKKEKGARFFHFSSPECIVFQERHINRSKATKREIEIKKMSRNKKLDLINS